MLNTWFNIEYGSGSPAERARAVLPRYGQHGIVSAGAGGERAMHSSPSSKVTVGLCGLGPKNPEKTRHICESNSWKLNTSKSGFTSIESFSFLKG